MMTLGNLIESYEKGAITINHFVVECTNLIDPAQPELVMDKIPYNLTPMFAMLVRSSEAKEGEVVDKMVTNHGTVPSVEQVKALKYWILHKMPHNEEWNN
jgi:hypothetical protein